MSTGPNENEPQGHPAWQEVLEGIPQEFHASLTAKLADMDKRAQDLVQGTQAQYAPYKEYIDANIPPEVLKQSLYLANQLQNDPEAFVQRAIENFKLEGYTKAEAEEIVNSQVNEWDGEDITQHPMMIQMAKQLEALNGIVTTQQNESQAQKEQREFDEYMEALQEHHKDDGPFDTLYVASLMANNVEAEDAVKQYYDMINNAVASRIGTQQVSTPNAPPVVMGGAGNAGSGSASEPVKMGSLSNGETQDLVIQMIEKMNQQNS